MIYCDRCIGTRPQSKRRKTATCSLCQATMDCNDRPNLKELLKSTTGALDQLWKLGFLKNEAKGMPIHATLATLDENDNPVLELRSSREIDVPVFLEGVKIRVMVCEPYYH